MFDLNTGLVQAARILAAPLWVLNFILMVALGAVAWGWFKGRQ